MTATENWSWDDSLDALTAAPQSHSILFENDLVRVLKAVLQPNQGEPMHTHLWPSIIIVQESVRIRYYDANQSYKDHARRLIPLDKPFVEYVEPEGPHAVENVDIVTYRAVRVEIKTTLLLLSKYNLSPATEIVEAAFDIHFKG